MIKQLDFFTSIVIYGKYGSGKTTCACTAPKPILLLDIDNKAKKQVNIRELVKHKYVDIVSFDDPLVGGGDLDFLQRKTNSHLPKGYENLVKCVSKVVKEVKKEYATIVIDSGTRLIQHLIQAIVSINAKDQMTQNLWGVFYTEMANRFTRLSTVPCNLIWLFHERMEKDETTKKDVIYPSVPGQMGTDIGSYFNEVYNMKVEEINGKHYYYLVTKANKKYANRTSGALDLKEPPNLTKIIEKLKA